jgi:cytochrome b6-f complex iron-sulfur subunit
MADDAKGTKGRLDLPPVERRAFLRYGMFGAVSAGLGGFGLASLAFLYPRPGDELTGEVPLETAETLADTIQESRVPIRVPDGGISIVTWDPGNDTAMSLYGEDHAIVESSGIGLMALYTQRCVHLGCAVPWCQSSQWFECPCHGSRYNRWGEYTGGPAPRGLDRYSSFIDDSGVFVVDLGNLITGTARTANALEQPQEGPNCVEA